jgi:hypothetical protein
MGTLAMWHTSAQDQALAGLRCHRLEQMIMREWTILVREKPSGDPNLVAVPSRFSWGAFLFQALWALYHKAWLTALVLLIVGMLVPLAGEVVGLAPGSMVVLQIALAVIMALGANEIRIGELHLRRFRTIAILKAHNLDEAEIGGFEHWLNQSETVLEAGTAPDEALHGKAQPLWQP